LARNLDAAVGEVLPTAGNQQEKSAYQSGKDVVSGQGIVVKNEKSPVLKSRMQIVENGPDPQESARSKRAADQPAIAWRDGTEPSHVAIAAGRLTPSCKSDYS
jgi:hypothetical protein